VSRNILILTKPPYGCEEPEKAMKMILRFMDDGDDVAIYLLGDGVELTKSSQKGDLGKLLEEIADKGGEIYSSDEDMQARGLYGDRILNCVKLRSNIFKEIVDDAMERADRVLSC